MAAANPGSARSQELRARAVELALQAALGRPGHPIQAQQIVQEAGVILAFLDPQPTEGDAS
jgi:hypothetical protein